MITKSRTYCRALAAFNATFISLIPNFDSLISLEEFRPISLCNCIYKIIAKVITRSWVGGILSKPLSQEQLTRLFGKQAHESIGVDQEGMHSINVTISNYGDQG